MSPDFFKNFVYGGDDPDKSKQIGTAGIRWGTEYGKLLGDALGYDPTGAYTWSDIESDQEGLYQKYLNRGTLYDDPLSGILAPPKQKYYGGIGGGYGGDWGDYGGGGGGGYGGYGYGPQP